MPKDFSSKPLQQLQLQQQQQQQQQQPMEDSLMSLLQFPSQMGVEGQSFAPFNEHLDSFCDPFDDPDMEPLPLGPGIANDCFQQQQQQQQQQVKPMEAPSLESLMALNDLQQLQQANLILENNNPMQFLSSILDPIVQISAGSKRNFENTSSFQQQQQKQQEQEQVVEETCVNKRQKLDYQFENDNEESIARFRPYQENQWRIQFKKLIEFKLKNGHCCVPHSFPEDPILARWVKRQRYQYKKLNEKDPSSTMTTRRIEELESVGFVWHSHAAAWMEKLNDLKAFKAQTGHCNVPSHYPENVQLSTWVKCQRRQYKLYISGASSNMTVQRFEALEDLGFVFDIRNKSSKKKK
ncbi:unnamed protein product [Cylindrotheca closterium]|uniref:Helicase-associated domain-containing protein n=1 Tax=Cylindrotheca closterium TaxID=2856 RepID=A0AAD2CKK3_9STRA|nr:unnamed protein product [Cylindrotheca closterium]